MPAQPAPAVPDTGHLIKQPAAGVNDRLLKQAIILAPDSNLSVRLTRAAI